MDGWMDGWKEGRKEGRMDGWMGAFIHLIPNLHSQTQRWYHPSSSIVNYFYPFE
jgi:hypothetical protein